MTFKPTCGPCSMCCTAMSVPELDKPNGVRCDHLTPAGKCGIYEDRPESCQVFECAFLRGYTPMGTRPDQIGGVLHVEDGGLGEEGQALVIYTTEGSRDRWRRSKYIQRLIGRFMKKGSGAFIVKGQDRQLITAPGSRLHRMAVKAEVIEKDEEA